MQRLSPVTKLKLGTVYQSTSLLLGVKVRGQNIVTKYNLNKEFELQNSTGPLQWQVNYKLRNQQGETLLICATTISSRGESFAFTVPILKLLARRELQADLQGLKIAVEQHLG